MKDSGYGLWTLVVLNSAIFIVFATSFFHPRGGRDWRALGEAWDRYAAVTTRFVPRLDPVTSPPASQGSR